MPVIDYPKMCVQHFHTTDVFLVADSASTARYCIDYLDGATFDSVIAERQRFSNDGALAYQYWTGTEWKLEFGFKQIAVSLTYH